MRARLFILAHVLTFALGTTALWWFVLRDDPAVAVADGITAAAVAGWFEIMMMRLGQ